MMMMMMTTNEKKKKLHPESALHLINFFCSFSNKFFPLLFFYFAFFRFLSQLRLLLCFEENFTLLSLLIYFFLVFFFFLFHFFSLYFKLKKYIFEEENHCAYSDYRWKQTAFVEAIGTLIFSLSTRCDRVDDLVLKIMIFKVELWLFY